MRSKFFLIKSSSFLALVLLVSCCTPEKSSNDNVEATAKTANPKDLMSPRTNVWTQEWSALFDGKTLFNWAVTDFAGHGDAVAEPGQIKINAGVDLSGITWTNGSLPKSNYEILLEAKKLDGNDFFCGLTFPVGDSHCSLILGGWGGSVAGLSSLDDLDASENETTKNLFFEKNRWFPVRVQVTAEKIQAWLGEDQIVDAKIANRKISLRPGDIERSIPLGIATYMTTSAVRNMKLRLLP